MTLDGLRVLVPRSGAAGERWADAIRRRGGEPVIVPLIATAPPADAAPLTAAVERWNRGDYDWMVVTSPRGAAAIAEAGARPRPDRGIAAVGPATADELRERGFDVDLVPEHDFSARGLAAALLGRLDTAAALLLPLSALADDTLADALRDAGHAAERVDAYRTVPAPADPSLEAAVTAGIDAVLVSSGSVARELARRLAPAPAAARLIAIGPPTARALAQHGLDADATADRHTVDGMLDALETVVARPPGEAHGPRAAPPARSTPAPSQPRDKEAHA